MSRVSLVSLLLASSVAVACGDGSTPEEAAASRAAAGGAEQQPGSSVPSSPVPSSPVPSSPVPGSPAGSPDPGHPPPNAAAGSDDGATLPAGGNTGGADGANSLPPPVFCDAPAKIFVPSCGIGSCHENPGAVMGDFAVDTKRAYNFVDKVSTRHADCGRIIDSRDYSQSLLLLKVRGEIDTPYCGGIMPIPSYPPLSANQIDCIASWLQQFQR